MAGLSGDQVVIDVVAAAGVLSPALAAPESSVTAGVVTSPEAACALGHPNTAEARFCVTCGLPMDARVSAGRAEPSRPRPEAELSEQEKAERESRHAAAVAAAAQFENREDSYVPSEGEAVLIHFIADGLTAFGQVWYRGQELAIGPDHPRWKEARDWITLSRFDQAERWGEQKFDFGPWPGRGSYADAAGSFEQLTVTDPQGNKVSYSGPSEEQLRAADEAERRRGRAVPAPAF
jgi:hypothetical protein